MRKCFFVSGILYCERSQVYTFDQFTYSLCEQVGRSSTPSTKQKLNQLKLFFPKRKSYIPAIPKEWNEKNVFFLIFLKLGIYIM